MDQFPQMLYRAPGSVVVQNGMVSTQIAESDAELRAFLGDGWHETADAALEAHKAEQNAAAERRAAEANAAAMAAANANAPDTQPPTRAELEVKAKELGIQFDGRTSDAKLSKAIADKLAG